MTKLFALLMMVNGLAPVIAPLIGGQLLLFTTWRVIFVILAIFSAILLVGSLLFRESLPKKNALQVALQLLQRTTLRLLKISDSLTNTNPIICLWRIFCLYIRFILCIPKYF
ncbi:MAG: MFS transporter [Veillonella sp.]